MIHYFVQNGKTDKLKLIKNSRASDRVDGPMEGGPKSVLILATFLIIQLKNFSHTSVKSRSELSLEIK